MVAEPLTPIAMEPRIFEITARCISTKLSQERLVAETLRIQGPGLIPAAMGQLLDSIFFKRRRS